MGYKKKLKEKEEVEDRSRFVDEAAEYLTAFFKPAISSATAIINRRLKAIAIKAKIVKNISTHVGRHTFATNLITEGVDIYVVKELLGHQDLKITQIYAKVVDSKKAEAIKKLNY